MSLQARLVFVVLVAATASPAALGQQDVEEHRPPAWVIPNRPASASLSVPQFDRIHADLSRNGRVRILARLRRPATAPEGLENRGDRARPRDHAGAELEAQQDGVLHRLSAAASRAARKFEFIPFM